MKDDKSIKKGTPKIMLLSIGIVVIVAVIVAVVASSHIKDKTSTKLSDSSKFNNSSADKDANTTYPVREACNVLTASVAQTLVGSDAKMQTPTPDTTPSGFNASYCAYSGGQGIVSLYVRSPLTKTASDSNAKQFGSGRPKNTQTLSGYGDAAYWDRQYSQLDVLKHNIWYVLSITGADNSHTLPQATKFAGLIKGEF